jgi:outer membrane protein assembly factor BamB
LWEDFVIINASVESESVVALDKKTGKRAWKVPQVRESWNTPIISRTKDGDAELIFAMLGKIVSVDPKTGDQNWNCDTDIGWYMVPSLLATDDAVYAIGGRSGIAALAVRKGGKGDVTKSHRIWTGEKGSNVSSPVLKDGHLYCVNDSRGVALCIEVKSGKVVYEERLSGGDSFYASATLANDKIYYLSRDGRTFVVAASPKYKLLATNELDRYTIYNASPVVVEGELFLRSDKALYCIAE